MQDPIRVDLPGGGVATLDRRSASEFPQRVQPDPTPVLDRVGAWIGRRLRRDDGSVQTENPADVPRPAPILTTGAIAKVHEANALLNDLRKQIGDIHGRAAASHAATGEHAQAVADLKRLEDHDADVAAQHSLARTRDTSAQERAKGIAEAERRVSAAARAKVVGAAAIRKSDAIVSELQAAVTALEARIRVLSRAALEELLAQEAPILKATAERHYAASVRVFAITRALASSAVTPGEIYGAGSEAMLVMPTPAHPAFNFRTVPALAQDVAAETARVLEAIKQ